MTFVLKSLDHISNNRMIPSALSALILLVGTLAASLPSNVFISIPPIENQTSTRLSVWPSSPFREFIYEPHEFIEIIQSFSDDRDAAFAHEVLSGIMRISNTQFPFEKDTSRFRHIHSVEEPVAFDLRTVGGTVTGWQIFEILAVVYSVEHRYGLASFSASYIKDDVRLADFCLVLNPETANH